MTPAVPLAIKDPTSVPTYGDGPVSRWCKVNLYDPRDEIFVRLTIKMVTLMSLAMIAFFAVPARWAWHVAPFYFLLWGWNVPPVILMLHCTMHRPFIRRPKWLAKAHPFLMSFFFGIPTGYAEHHMGMHHVEDNMGEDLSSTMRYRRDGFLHFLAYWARFNFFILPELTVYLAKKRRTTMAKRALIGDLSHQALIVGALLLNWRFGLVAFAGPYFIVRFMMMTGNWGQHAFINTELKNDGFANSITCINSGYNARCFNDGYHIGHHLKANRHWTEMPQDFLDNRATYAAKDAIVFEGLDFFLVSVLLWTGQWRVLAKHFVRLEGRERSDDDVIALLKSRVQPVRVEEWGAMQPGRA
ncbi:MAG: fatty acid desaturase family protein [Polyangiaceae bacterium]